MVDKAETPGEVEPRSTLADVRADQAEGIVWLTQAEQTGRRVSCPTSTLFGVSDAYDNTNSKQSLVERAASHVIAALGSRWAVHERSGLDLAGCLHRTSWNLLPIAERSRGVPEAKTAQRERMREQRKDVEDDLQVCADLGRAVVHPQRYPHALLTLRCVGTPLSSRGRRW